jgi:hypothetical protein
MEIEAAPHAFSSSTCGAVFSEDRGGALAQHQRNISDIQMKKHNFAGVSVALFNLSCFYGN